MGTYTTWEFYEMFGGWPDEGEAALDLAHADEIRKREKEDDPTLRDTSPTPRPLGK